MRDLTILLCQSQRLTEDRNTGQGGLFDDGTPERAEEAIKSYRRALEEDPDLVAALRARIVYPSGFVREVTLVRE